MAILLEREVRRRRVHGETSFRVLAKFANDERTVVVTHSDTFVKGGPRTPAQFKADFKAAVQDKLTAAEAEYASASEVADRGLLATVTTALEDIATELT